MSSPTTSVAAFNSTLQEFLNELSATFPEESAIRKYKNKFELTKSTKPRLALDKIMPDLSKHSQNITQRNESLFMDNASVIEGIDLKKLWTSGISDNTKKVIWDYLNTLLMLGTTIKAIPSQMLEQIEDMANNCVKQIESGEIQTDNLFMMAQQALMQNGMFQNMIQTQNQGQTQENSTPTLDSPKSK